MNPFQKKFGILVGAAVLSLGAMEVPSSRADDRDPYACSSRQWVHPMFGPKMGRILARKLRRKGYRPLAFEAPRFEHFRATAAFRGPMASDPSARIEFYFQVFNGRNFDDMIRLEVSTDVESRQTELLKLFEQIPPCPRR